MPQQPVYCATGNMSVNHLRHWQLPLQCLGMCLGPNLKHQAHVPCLLPCHLRGLIHLLIILRQHALSLQTQGWGCPPWADLIQSVGS